MRARTKDILNTTTVKKYLSQSQLDIDCEVLTSVTSTQEYCRKLSVARDTIIVAEEQGCGVGRMGRSFYSRKGGCYFSIILLNKPKSSVFSIISAVSVAVTTVLRRYGLKATIKWPNDILIKTKKICGILCSSHADRMILGVGINCYNNIHDIADIATSFELENIKKVIRAKLIAEVVKKIYNLFGKDISTVTEMYNAYFSFKNNLVKVSQNGKDIIGTVLGINNDGHLLLATKNGQVPISHGDVIFLTKEA